MARQRLVLNIGERNRNRFVNLCERMDKPLSTVGETAIEEYLAKTEPLFAHVALPKKPSLGKFVRKNARG